MLCRLIIGALILAQFSFCAMNESSSHLKMDKSEFKRKNYKFINFNTEDSGDVAVELAFNVPFLTIPTKKAVSMTKGALATVNVGSIVLAGAIAIGALLAIPAINTFLTTKEPALKTKRSENKEDILWNQLNSKIQQVLQDNELDSRACIQRMACWIVKNSTGKVSRGIGSSKDKILDGVASNEWFKTMIKDSILYDPINLAQSGGSCAREYWRCKISQRSVQGVLKEITKSWFFNFFSGTS